MHGLSVVAEHRLLIVEASAVADHGFYSAQESVVTAYGLGSCGSWTQLPQGMWDILQPRIKPVFPALQGGFLTTGLPGKPLSLSFNTSEFTSPLASTLPSIYWVGQKVFVHLGFSEYPNKLFGLFNKSTECHISWGWEVVYFRRAAWKRQCLTHVRRRQLQPTPVLLPGKSLGQSLAGCSPWGREESGMTE